MKVLDEIIFEFYSKSFKPKMSLPTQTVEYHPSWADLAEWCIKNELKFSPDEREMMDQCELVEQFHWAREYFATAPVPMKTGFNGTVRRLFDGRLDEGDALSGTIPWKSFHQADWPCSECGHAPADHYLDFKRVYPV
jgi:hypothetical protein